MKIKIAGVISLLGIIVSLFLFIYYEQPVLNLVCLLFSGVWLYIFSRIVKRANNF